jgi:hypothetical protein
MPATRHSSHPQARSHSAPPRPDPRAERSIKLRLHGSVAWPRNPLTVQPHHAARHRLQASPPGSERQTGSRGSPETLANRAASMNSITRGRGSIRTVVDVAGCTEAMLTETLRDRPTHGSWSTSREPRRVPGRSFRLPVSPIASRPSGRASSIRLPPGADHMRGGVKSDARGVPAMLRCDRWRHRRRWRE